jgi:hypothetical protein
MTFETWVEQERAGSKQTRTAFLRDLSESCGLSLQTLRIVFKGGKLGYYATAKTLSEATGGLVTIQELCE